MLNDLPSLDLLGFKVLSENGKRDRGIFVGEREILCKYEYATLVEHALMGYPIGNAGGIFWAQADVWPNRPDTTCRGCTVRGEGRKGGTGRDQLTYSHARIVATYSNAFDPVNGQQNPDPNTTPDETAIASCDIGATMFNLGKQPIKFTTSGKSVPPDVNPSISVFHREITVPITNSTRLPSEFDTYVGKINSKKLFGAAPFTVLYMSAQATQKRLVVPAVPLPAISAAPPTILNVFDYVHKFAVRGESWEKFLDPSTGLFDTLDYTAGGQVHPYGTPVDLIEIFQKPT